MLNVGCWKFDIRWPALVLTMHPKIATTPSGFPDPPFANCLIRSSRGDESHSFVIHRSKRVPAHVGCYLFFDGLLSTVSQGRRRANLGLEAGARLVRAGCRLAHQPGI